MKKTRSSNFELLRITAMLMIVFFHVIYHWPVLQITDVNTQNLFQNGLFNSPEFYKKLWIIDIAMPMGIVGNGLFMILSGYFLAGRSEINLLKTSKKILSHLGYATIVLVMGSCLVYYLINQKYYRYFVLEKITDFNAITWWFIGYYYLVIVIAAFFLNKHLIRLEKKEYLTILIVVFAVMQIGWSGSILEALAGGLRVLGIGIFFYMLGGYIHRYDPFANVRSYVFILSIIAANIMNCVSSYNDTQNKILNFQRGGAQGTFLQQFYLPQNYDILTVVLVISIFEIFKRIKIPDSGIINYIGASTLMIYLIHENGFFQSVYNQMDCVTLLYYDPCMFIIKMLEWTFIGFGLGLLAYVLYGCGPKLWKHVKWIAVKEPKD